MRGGLYRVPEPRVAARFCCRVIHRVPAFLWALSCGEETLTCSPAPRALVTFSLLGDRDAACRLGNPPRWESGGVISASVGLRGVHRIRPDPRPLELSSRGCGLSPCFLGWRFRTQQRIPEPWERDGVGQQGWARMAAGGRSLRLKAPRLRGAGQQSDHPKAAFLTREINLLGSSQGPGLDLGLSEPRLGAHTHPILSCASPAGMSCNCRRCLHGSHLVRQ